MTIPPAVQTIPATSPLVDIFSILERDGVIVLSGFAGEEEVDRLNKKAKAHFERCEAEGRASDSFYKAGGRASNTTAAYDLVGSCPEEVSDLLQRDLWHQIMTRYLSHQTWDWRGEEKVTRTSSYWLHTTIGYKVSPGANNQSLHRDLNSAGVQRTGPDTPIHGMSTFIAGTKVTAKNGGTHICPGSHLWPQDRAPRQEDSVAVEMEKGSLALWFSSIFHGAGANTEDPSSPDAVRIIYGLFAITDNFRQGETTLYSCSPEILKKMPPSTLRLLGFYAGRTGGGRYLGRNPVETFPPMRGYTGGEWNASYSFGEDKAVL